MFLIRWKLKTKKKAQNRHRGEANTRRTRKHLIVLETRRQAREESGESNRDAFDGKNQVSTGIEPADPWYRTSKGRYRTGAGEEGVLLMPETLTTTGTKSRAAFLQSVFFSKDAFRIAAV